MSFQGISRHNMSSYILVKNTIKISEID